MWKMFDDMIECNECGGPLGPPPKFTIPPPPRPPAISDYTPSNAHNCNEEEMALKAQQAWDNDMCEAIPILDASLYSSQSLQTSAMIAVFSLLLILVVLISSLFVWKNKRKVQNLLPCKTPTRGPHISGALATLGSGHAAVTYEDPDAHLGHHRPLVMRHYHNAEMLHAKSIHYPSGYPMTRSPPFLVSSSPGPDPYRSNDNVYEELGPSRDSDGESEPPLHSDDDFAEDELSLPGERSFNKVNNPENANNASTIYHERAPALATDQIGQNSNANAPERHSVMSSSSSNQDSSTATAASSSSSHNNNNSNGIASTSSTCAAISSGVRTGSAGLLTGMLRHTTARSKFHNLNNGARSKNERKPPALATNPDNLNTSTSTTEPNDISPIQQLYDNSSNLMSLGYGQQHQPGHAYNTAQTQLPAYHHHSLHHVHLNNNRQMDHTPTNFYNTIESEVERRNRINVQLKNTSGVATIFRERIQYPGSGRYPQHYYATNGSNGLLASSMRARTNPCSIERRRRVAADTVEPTYGYAEPVYHHNYHYESCSTPSSLQQRLGQTLAYPAYIVPEYSSGSINSFRHTSAGTYQNSTQIYAPGDSSFGSDSGYSHHTPASSIGRHDYDVAMPPIPPAPPAPTQKPPSKLATALSFSWNRKKTNTSNLLCLQPAETKHRNELSSTSPAEVSSPNNNSASSTITSGLENTTSTTNSSSSCSSGANNPTGNNKNNNNNNSSNVCGSSSHGET
ncbi:probable serine/threonine-protein kinase DDB_G0276461 [Glossina fuscipes]|uniref:Probable serine/threonine-protein kinase DDB_G0276461 n=1 Tax=Glossina fuscipes TaxID=7396 RepID=A0A9C5Z2U8_9MUSC|nr:probable serine/threonine-protein kinase DDB_G0276461 [Glossina fuscipes]KAI9580212.1 hypothetical protein GQX74_000205 [Glossina fuscipes]